jgi:hypothetical protein
MNARTPSPVSEALPALPAADIQVAKNFAQASKAPATRCSYPVISNSIRDRAILLLGFAGAFRRSKLVAPDVADLEFCDGGIRVKIRRSKTDQEGSISGSIAAAIAGSRPW